jgi:HAD superfamily hydrolase (TIGR01490 family)
MSARAIAFLDVDHTLTRRSTGYRLAVEAVRRGILSARSLAYMPFLYLNYRLGRPGHASFDLGRSVLRGMPLGLFEEAARAAFERTVRTDLYPAALDLVAALRAEGARVVLATSSFDLVIRPLAGLLGVGDWIASSLEFEDGLCTGRFVGQPVFSERKFELARALAAGAGVDLADCSFYSDSIHDLPLLAAVGDPVAVNPDPRLARLSRARGWRTLRFE